MGTPAFLRAVWPWAVVAVLVTPPWARADERFDHRGSLGLLLGPGVAFKDEITPGHIEDGGRLPLLLGATMAVGGSSNEVLLESITTLGGPHVDLGLAAGFRGYFGEERVKSFLTLEVAAHAAPAFTIGPRVGIGLEYELSSNVGTYAALTADFGYGAAIRFSGEAMLGLQVRTYVLE